ncbi:MAG: neutral/alkaline non-lysosomal ceramidase N-terminal domain-containing protein [Gemmataceae bacterium]
MRYLLITLMLCTTPLAASAQAFRAGAATSNITPPLGGDIVGGFAPFPATHIHDELHVRCLVLDDGKVKLVFVVCDLLGLDRLVSDEARASIHKDLGIPPDNVLISATHTHSACSALGKDARVITDRPDEYQRFVARRIVDGVKRAHNLLRPAQIAWGSAEAPEHVFNRRWVLKEGSKFLVNPFGKVDKVKMNPPVGSPDLVEPAGPTDPTISFIALREPAGAPIGLFAAYSLHYVGGVGPGHISADYYGMFCAEMERLFKAERQTPPFVALLANGTSGDINNIDFRKARPKKEPYEQMKYVADDVAGKVHAALGRVTWHDHVALAARYREPSIATRRPDADLLAWAKKTIAEKSRVKGKTDLSLVYAERTLRMAAHPETLKMPLQAFRVGDLALATMPCEIFCEIGLEYKKRSPIRPAFMVSLNHGYYGYLPTPRHHKLGGYETWLGTNRLEPTASEKMLDALLEMTAEMKGR